MEARRNAGRNMSGDSVAFAINPKHPFRDGQYRGAEGSRPGDGPRQGTVKNHLLANRRMIKAVEKRVRQDQLAEQERASAPLFRMKKFADVQGTLSAQLSSRSRTTKASGSPVNLGASAGRNSKLQTDQIGDVCEQIAGLNMDENANMENPQPSKSASKAVASTPKNFIRRNVRQAIAASTPITPPPDELPISKTVGFGRVPLYIHKRKLEMAKLQEKRRFENEKEKLPPGMALMSEDERQRTVDLLMENQQKLTNQIAKMPLTIETPSMIERHNSLHEKLQEVEAALKLFHRKKVYITA